MGMLKQAAAPAADEAAPESAGPPADAAAPGPADDGSATAEQAATDAGVGGDSEGPEDAQDPGEGGEGEGDAGAQTGEKATPQEQAEYDRAAKALHVLLYANDGTSNGIFGMLQPQDKIGSVAKAAMLVIHQLDEKVHMQDVIIPQITLDTVSALIEMAEVTKKMQFSEAEAKAALAATFEGVLRIFGFSANDAKDFVDKMSPQERSQHISEYHTALEQAQGSSQAQPGGPADQQVPTQTANPGGLLAQGQAQQAAPAPAGEAESPAEDQSAGEEPDAQGG